MDELQQLTPQEQSWLQQHNAYKERYLNRVSEVATKLGGSIDAYEIWNEPDQPSPTSPVNSRLPPAQFGQLLQDAYTRVKATDPTSHVVVGGLDSGQPDYLKDAAAATGGVLYADKLRLHPHGTPKPEEGLASLVGYNYQQKLREANVMLPGADGEPPSVPERYGIYVTEASMPREINPPETYMPSFADTADDMPEIERYHFFWNGTFDHHPGLNENPEAMRAIRARAGR